MKRKDKRKALKRSKGALLLAVFLLLMVRFQLQPRGVSGYVPYTQAPTIIIDGNSEFSLNSSGAILGNGGNGTEGNPYIIEGWSICLNGRSSPGIEISNTDVHFIVRNCLVWDILNIGSNAYGLKFTNVTHGVIDDCHFQPYNYGTKTASEPAVVLENCLNCTVKNTLIQCDQNTHLGINYAGIYLYNTNHSTIGPGNIIKASTDIKVFYSHFNNISGNNLLGKTISEAQGVYGSLSSPSMITMYCIDFLESTNNLFDSNFLFEVTSWRKSDKSISKLFTRVSS